MKELLKTLGVLIIVFAIPAGVASCAVAVWKDCRKDHGLLYCTHVIAK